jgi:hypothetical protein
LKITNNGLNIKAIKFEYIAPLAIPPFANEKPIFYYANGSLTGISKMPIDEVMIYDSLGKLVTANRFSNSLLEVNIPFEYSNGIYLVVFKTENGMLYKTKFIKF